MELFDTHCHTELSSCAEDVSLQMYVDHARHGCHPFAITDHSAHLFYPPENMWGFWSDAAEVVFEACYEDGVARSNAYFARLQEHRVPGMLAGVELDVLPDGRVVFDESLLPRLDIVVGAVHGVRALRRELPDGDVEAELKSRFLRLCDLGVHSLAHPFREWRHKNRAVAPALLEWLVDAAADGGVALELNCHYEVADVDLAMVRMCLERGVAISIATDTHRAREFGDFSYHVRILSEAGLAPDEWSAVLLGARVFTTPG